MARGGGVLAVDPLRALAAALSRAGWGIRNIDIDLVAGRAVVEMHRYDGRWLYLTSDASGRASIERWHREPRIVRCFNDGPEVDSHYDQFLGRVRYEGARSALRSMTTYIADNPSPGFLALPVSAVRALLGALL